MSIENGTVEYRLKNPFKYAHGGDSQCESKYLELNEPTMEHFKHYSKLKQMLTRAQFDFAAMAQNMGMSDANDMSGEEVKPFHESSSDHESTEENEEAIKLCIQTSDKVDLFEFVDTFRKLIIARTRKPICMVDSVEKFTESMWDKLNVDEAFNIAVRWCSFFVTALIVPQSQRSGQQLESVTVAKVV